MSSRVDGYDRMYPASAIGNGTIAVVVGADNDTLTATKITPDGLAGILSCLI